MDERYFRRMAESIEKEAQEDEKHLSPQDMASRGRAILDLKVVGRFKCEMDEFSYKYELADRSNPSKRLTHNFKPKSLIEIQKLRDPNVPITEDGQCDNEANEESDTADHNFPRILGIVVSIRQFSITVLPYSMVDMEVGTDNLWIGPGNDRGAITRMLWAVNLMSQPECRGPIANLMLGSAGAKVASMNCEQSHLNESQHLAMQYCLGSNLSIVHGPPGTGKTKTISELVLRLVSRGERVLICGPTNASVDAIIERLSPHYDKAPHLMLRLGHPGRISDIALKHSAELIAAKTTKGRDLKDWEAEILRRLRRARTPGKRQALKAQRDQMKSLWNKYLGEFVRGSKVVGATLHHGGSDPIVGSAPVFDALIIDEISQALVPQAWIPAVADPGISRLVIAGDNQQLSPMIKSRSPMVKKMLGGSLFDALFSIHGAKIKHMLQVQYRMSSKIMELPAMALYENNLTADPSNANQLLSDLPNVNLEKLGSLATSPVQWIATP